MSKRQRIRIMIWVDPHDMGWVWKSYEDGMIKKFLVPEDPNTEEGDPREFARGLRRHSHNGGHIQREPRHRPHKEPGELNSINYVLQFMQTDPEKTWQTKEIEEMMPDWGYATSTAITCLMALKRHGLVEPTGHVSEYRLTEDGMTCPHDKDLPFNPEGG